ncbi:hypothetical protein [Halorarum salinum]|uniref:Uncharacterized protein n=1 Tax=Halorarum salinum TaxID=2743089 RepID=A0A7D5QHE7_9EURY|nr:hypothetical protein [Halobaculum salinum]QLG62843.1 hypothetical protein HUG12_14340 [Halobaculum salinum]
MGVVTNRHDVSNDKPEKEFDLLEGEHHWADVELNEKLPLDPATVQRKLRRTHAFTDEDDRVTEEGLEALRAYDPDEWDSLDEFIEACVDA